MQIRKFLISALAAAAIAVPVFADAEKEAFVRDNGQQVLASLNDSSLSAEQRTVRFGEYMEEFTDMERVAFFVLGRHRFDFSDEELEEYVAAFKRYALAVYEVQLDQYRGEEINVTGSTERSETDAVVETVIRRADGQDLEVLWRVIERGGQMNVMDVALNIDGNLIWLAIEQRQQIDAVADRSREPARAVINKLNQMTEKLEAEKRASLGKVSGKG